MKIGELINERLRFLKTERSEGSYSYYHHISKYLMSYFGDYEVDNITTKDINNFVTWCKENTELSNSSINKYLKELKSVYKHNGIYNLIVIQHPYLRARKKRFNQFTEEQVEIAFKYISGLKSDYKLMYLTFYYTGLRRSELCNLRKDDFDYLEETLLVKEGKSIEDRLVIIKNPQLLELLREQSAKGESDYLFYNYDVDRPYIKNDFKNFNRRVRAATGLEQFHVHMFRHTYCTDLIEDNVALTTVKQQAGHSDIATTMRYYHASLKFQRAEMEKSHRKEIKID